MPLDPTTNFAKTTASAGYDAVAVTVVLASGQGALLPDPGASGAFNLTYHNFTDYPDPSDDPNVEIVRCTARVGDSLTIVRAQEGTVASTKNTSGKVYHLILAPTSKTISDINTAIQAILASLLSFKTVTGTIDGSNKSFSIATKPTLIMTDKGTYAELATFGFTWSAGIATLPLAPSRWCVAL